MLSVMFLHISFEVFSDHLFLYILNNSINTPNLTGNGQLYKNLYIMINITIPWFIYIVIWYFGQENAGMLKRSSIKLIYISNFTQYESHLTVAHTEEK